MAPSSTRTDSPFLEGRTSGGVRQVHERIEPPLVPDGTVHRALEKLLVLNGERISYRALDVEQIGSVYEAMMGFTVETAHGLSIGLGPDHLVINLEDLLTKPDAGVMVPSPATMPVTTPSTLGLP